MEQTVTADKNNGYGKVWDVIFEWWEKIQKPEKAGLRAELRRARNPDAVAMKREYLFLYKDIVKADIPEPIKVKLRDRLPLIVGILSHVKKYNDLAVAATMSSNSKPGSDRPLVSDLRFRRLMKTEDEESLYISMIRMVRMMDGKVNVKDLSESLFFWNDMTRKKWASQYYLHKDIY